MANSHVLNAFKALAAADPKTDTELLASAQISATLAIAEELRTANLIAWRVRLLDDGAIDDVVNVDNRIQTRLGGAA